MIRIQAIAPFRYEYLGKLVWLTSGESMYLNASDASQREELKYILSDRFPFKQYIYVNLDSVDQALKVEVGEEDGFYKIENHYPLPEEVCPVVPASFTAPYEEPADNPFVHPIINSVIPSSNEDISIVRDLPSTCPPEETEEKENVEDQKVLIESRTKELNYAAWGKIKNIAETYGIAYTNKSETISRILEVEFGDEE